jgi:hypothetical protein
VAPGHPARREKQIQKAAEEPQIRTHLRSYPDHGRAWKRTSGPEVGGESSERANSSRGGRI